MKTHDAAGKKGSAERGGRRLAGEGWSGWKSRLLEQEPSPGQSSCTGQSAKRAKTRRLGKGGRREGQQKTICDSDNDTREDELPLDEEEMMLRVTDRKSSGGGTGRSRGGQG